MKKQFKKITTHALNLMDYNSKHHKVFKIKKRIQKQLIKNNLIRQS